MWQGGVHGRRGVCGGACVAGGHVWQGGMCGRGACVAGRVHGRGACVGGMCGWGGACVAGETAIVVGGMYPTGMHSCNGLFRFLMEFIVTADLSRLMLVILGRGNFS